MSGHNDLGEEAADCRLLGVSRSGDLTKSSMEGPPTKPLESLDLRECEWKDTFAFPISRKQNGRSRICDRWEVGYAMKKVKYPRGGGSMRLTDVLCEYRWMGFPG